MSRLLATGMIAIAVLIPAALASAQSVANPETQFSSGVHAYFNGQFDQAKSLFSNAIKKGSADPRVYYYRGLTLAAEGDTQAAAIDFQQGAMLEAAPQNRNYNVGRSLERIQGPLRMQIEGARRNAKFLAKEAAKQKSIQDLKEAPVIPDVVPKTTQSMKTNLPDVKGVENPGTPFDQPLKARDPKVVEKIAMPSNAPAKPTNNESDDPFDPGQAPSSTTTEDDPFDNSPTPKPSTTPKPSSDEEADPFGSDNTAASDKPSAATGANMAFEIHMADLMSNPLSGMAKGVMESQAVTAPGGGEVEKIKRVWGAVELPEDAMTIMSIDNSSDLPMEMFVQIEMVDAGSTDAMLDSMAADSDQVQKDGKTYYTPKGGPSNVMAWKSNDTTIEIATPKFMKQGPGVGLFAPGLKSAWKSFPEAPIRVAIDIEAARPLIDQGLDMAKEQTPAMLQGILGLVNKMNDLRIAIDFNDGSNLLSLGMICGDEEAAEEVRSGIDGLLGMGKMMAGSQIDGLREMDANLADVASAVLASLEAKRDGNDVQIVIPKPEGFDEAVQSGMSMGAGADGF